MSVPNTLQCLCGTVELSMRGAPAARANCHCRSCRDFYGTSVWSATAWAADQVTISRGSVSAFKHPAKRLTRHFCTVCGETMFGTNRLGMRVLPNSLVARACGGELPDALKPTMHLFYRHRLLDVQDALPKYLDGWDGPTAAL
ncbi:GFA family protein [Paraburkholderia sp. D15]|uniref:GFA family protein n=1 Tax=Paraburkholderia sp. D15 TaxID=2880218 RepID=UPI00247A973B|nr:GFA family protein [Paraburkholderia sp. D15]WGS52627.1 GFA family protein [Paraburkholderia sp. D15]